MFSSLITQESPVASEVQLDEVIQQAEDAVAVAMDSDALLADVSALEAFGQAVLESKDLASLVAFANHDGNLAAIFGQESTDGLLVLGMEALAEGAERTAAAAEESEAEGEEGESKEGAASSNAKKWKVAGTATVAALVALAAGFAAYKWRKGQVPEALQAKMLGDINRLRKMNEEEALSALPENPSAEVAATLRRVSRGAVEERGGADEKVKGKVRKETAKRWSSALATAKSFRATAERVDRNIRSGVDSARDKMAKKTAAK